MARNKFFEAWTVSTPDSAQGRQGKGTVDQKESRLSTPRKFEKVFQNGENENDFQKFADDILRLGSCYK